MQFLQHHKSTIVFFRQAFEITTTILILSRRIFFRRVSVACKQVSSWADPDAIPEGQWLIAYSPVQTKQSCAPDPVRT